MKFLFLKVVMVKNRIIFTEQSKLGHLPVCLSEFTIVSLANKSVDDGILLTEGLSSADADDGDDGGDDDISIVTISVLFR